MNSDQSMEAPWNNDLRIQIVDLVRRAGEGHIPSSFSIVDIISFLYSEFLSFDPGNPEWDARDRFVLSKGHGAAALFVVLAQQGLINPELLNSYGTPQGILGGHPDSVTTNFVESSTGSLGHGFPGAVGIALGLKIRGSAARVVALVGDGECHEGTIWEAANVAVNLKLSNLIVFVDLNSSAAELMPIDNMPAKWAAFGWDVLEINGHNREEIQQALAYFSSRKSIAPLAIVAKTIKGKGVSLIEGHGPWHHRIPNEGEYKEIIDALSMSAS